MTGAAPASPALAGAHVDDAVLALRPDYRALLVVVTGVRGGPSDAASEAALARAERSARERLAGAPPETLPEIATWREALLGFGVRPRQARSSVEAHLRPIVGEDLGRYRGAPRLVRARGDEPFDTVADGVPTTVVADDGEVVWRDDLGVTCRRWNWRQCVRTRLDETTTKILFIIDGLQPTTTDALEAAGATLVDAVTAGVTGAVVESRLLGLAP